MARILIVDDDSSIRDLLRMHLSIKGHSIATAADAVEAIPALLQDVFDMVVTDVDMPYLNGIELLRAIRGTAETSHIPVILLTGRSDDDTWTEAMQAGAAGFLTKPIVSGELQMVIDSTLRAISKRSAEPAGGARAFAS